MFSWLEENDGRFCSIFDENDGRFGLLLDEKDGLLLNEDGKEGLVGKEDFFLFLLKGWLGIFLSRLDSNEGKSIDGGDGKGRFAFLRNFFGGIFDGVGEGEEDGDTLN